MIPIEALSHFPVAVSDPLSRCREKDCPRAMTPTGVPEVRNEFWSLRQWFTAQFSADLEIPFRIRAVFLFPDRSISRPPIHERSS
jgi:hypothetical protein